MRTCRTEFVTADKFVPVRFDDSGKPVDVAFLTVKRVGEYDYYTKMERHYFTNGNLTIETSATIPLTGITLVHHAAWMRWTNGQTSTRVR